MEGYMVNQHSLKRVARVARYIVSLKSILSRGAFSDNSNSTEPTVDSSKYLSSHGHTRDLGEPYEEVSWVRQ